MVRHERPTWAADGGNGWVVDTDAMNSEDEQLTFALFALIDALRLQDQRQQEVTLRVKELNALAAEQEDSA